ncbi:MAG: RIIA protein [Candidatus Gottesmanbacteria bacterium GW2011_GWB1_49_7]|uniref:RIIA protein n=1 Tax=Candidatus Gottesmanbacteria bacterium GW2011_GWB1_49_7 TaxID=1618448 RepID=A0A0G1YCV5_9BACT|nr:MAG: RIIA protein [Candidatus Gottesmanbacteria bacterium GW2011_GWB1_49_7]
MKTEVEDRTLVTSGVTSVSVFGISKAAETHIMTILRDTLYTDKILAPLREYSTNAWDAHRSIGKDDLPIRVTLPTPLNPTLMIRDWGPGMSEEVVLYTYTQYGDSTKRETNNEAGNYGIGAKSAFAYSDSFTVTSWHGGFKKIYSAVLDESNAGIMQKLHEEPCGDETGIEVQMPVKPKDIEHFEARAVKLFKYFKPLPDINIIIPELRKFSIGTPYGYLDKNDHSTGWTAVMGPIPYKLDLNQIESLLQDEELYGSLRKLCGVLYFDIGEVQTATSREELRYSDYTIKAVVSKIRQMYEHYIESLITLVSSSDNSNFHRRLEVSTTCKGFGIRLSKQYQKWTIQSVPLYTEANKPKTFTISNIQNNSQSVIVDTRTTLYIKNEVKSIKGYGLGDYACIVTPIAPDPVDFKVLREELDKYVKEANLDGVPITDISTVLWAKENTYTTVRTKSGKVRCGPINPVYRARCFEYNPGVRGDKFSDSWEIVTRIPSKNDVFVILDKFEVCGLDFIRMYRDDASIMKSIGLKMPGVYGYKTTEKKPVSGIDCIGKHYRDWRVEWAKETMTAMNLGSLYNDMARVKSTKDSLPHNVRHYPASIEKRFAKLLGRAHPLYLVVREYTQLERTINKNETLAPLVEHIRGIINDKTVVPPIGIIDTMKKYPMLHKLHKGGFSIFSDGEQELVNCAVEYIKLIDSLTEIGSENVEYYI